THLTADIDEALGRLLPQLNAELGVPDAGRIRRVPDDPDVVLLVARDGDRHAASAPDVVYTTPLRGTARLEEAVGDRSARRAGACSGERRRVLAPLEVAVQVSMDLRPRRAAPIPVALADVDLRAIDVDHEVRHEVVQ